MLAAAALAEVESARAKKRQVELAGSRPSQTLASSEAKVEAGRTAEIVGEKLGIGRATVNRGIKVRKEGTEV